MTFSSQTPFLILPTIFPLNSHRAHPNLSSNPLNCEHTRRRWGRCTLPWRRRQREVLQLRRGTITPRRACGIPPLRGAVGGVLTRLSTIRWAVSQRAGGTADRHRVLPRGSQCRGCSSSSGRPSSLRLDSRPSSAHGGGAPGLGGGSGTGKVEIEGRRVNRS
jgi:hypothetical protein